MQNSLNTAGTIETEGKRHISLRQKVLTHSAPVKTVHNTTLDLFQSTFQNAAVGIAHLDLQGYLLQANPRFCNFFEWTETELTHLAFSDLIHSDHRVHFQNKLDALIRGEVKFFNVEQRFIVRDSTLNWGHLSVSLAKPPSESKNFFIVVLENISHQKLIEAKLRNAEQQMKSIFESISDLVFVCKVQTDENHDVGITDINVAPTHPNYKNFDLVVEATTQYFWDQKTQPEWMPSVQKAFESDHVQHLEYSLTIKGEFVWFTASLSPMKDQQLLWVARNISDRKKAEQALFEEKELAQITLESIGDAVITTDINGQITQFNPIAEQILGWTSEEVLGRPIGDIFQVCHENTREALPNPAQTVLKQGHPIKRADPSILMSRNGTEYTIENSAAPILDQSSNIMGAVIIFHDVTYSRALTRQLSWQATHDPLTKLINRRQFDNVLQKLLTETQQDDQEHVLCFLDLDKFKQVNDTCGHAAGDELLRQVAKMFKKHTRDSDTLARLGGDEFAIILYRCPLDRAVVIANRLCNLVKTFQFVWANQIFRIGVSIGLVQINRHSPCLDEVVSRADTACYAAKAQGRNRIEVYANQAQKQLESHHHQQRVDLIRQALESDRLCLHAQSIVASEESSQLQPFACEVFLRLADQQGNLLQAGNFIQIAERTNLIVELDQWVINHLLPLIKSYQDRSESPIPLFMINLSGISLGDKKFLSFLQSQFHHYPTVATHLCFEISEATAITKLDETVHFIQEIKPFGCQFALDDFGRGMSSFAYLKTISVDYLKIDGSFIVEMMEDSATQTIIEAIHNVGHTLGMKTIAEFVENSSTRSMLQNIGVDYVQGYGITQPIPLEDYLKRLKVDGRPYKHNSTIAR